LQKNLLFLFSFTFFSLLENQAKDLKQEYDEVYALYQKYKGQDYSLVLPSAKAFLEKAKKEDDVFYLVKGHFLLGYLSEYNDDFGNAIIQYLEGARHAELSNIPELAQTNVSTQKNLARILARYKHFDLAHRFNARAVEIAKNNNLEELVILKLLAISKVSYYNNEGKHFEAIALIDSIKSAYSITDTIIQISLNSKKAYAYNKLGLRDSSEKYFKKTLVYDYSINALEYTSVLKHLADLAKDKAEYDSALYYLDLFETNLIPHIYWNVNQHLMDLDNDRAQIFIKMGNVKEAESQFKKLLEHGQMSGLESRHYEYYENVSDFYEDIGNLELALKYKNLFTKGLNEYLIQQKKIEELDKKYNIDLLTERYFEILAMSQEKNRAIRTAQISFGSVILILLTIIIALLYQKYHTRYTLRKELLKIELESEV